MAARSMLLLALGVVAAAEASSPLMARAGLDAGIDDSILKSCSLAATAQVKSYDSCYSSAFSAAGKNCKGAADACACTLASAVAKTCIPIVCPTAVASSLLSAVGCDSLTGSAKATGTGTGASAKKTSMSSVSGGSMTGSARGSGAAKTGSDSVFVTEKPTGSDGAGSQPSAAPTGGSSSGSGSGNNNANANGPSTTSSKALAGDVAVPVLGGALAGLVGALAVLL